METLIHKAVVIAAYASIFLGKIGYGSSPATVIQPTTAFTARLIQSSSGPANVLVGSSGQQEGTAWKSGFLSAKEGTSDRVIAEFDLRNQSAAMSATYEFTINPFTTIAPPARLDLYAFQGNGLANAADYFRIDQLITTFDDPENIPVNWSLDVTNAYNTAINNHTDFLGLIVKTEVGGRYNIVNLPALAVVVPEPPSMLLFTIAICAATIVGRRKSVPHNRV